MRGLALVVCALLVLPACGTGSAERARSLPGAAGAPGARAASVHGTVLDAQTGEPVAGVAIEGPGGVLARSDARGRFTLAGLRVGASGELVARAADGREGRNPLRPLRAGVLEVVVHLRWP